jgi:RHS repeat-associated protein
MSWRVRGRRTRRWVAMVAAVGVILVSLVAAQTQQRAVAATAAAWQVTTAAGNGVSAAVDGIGANAGFINPAGIVVLAGNAVVSDGDSLRQVNLATDEVTTWVGNPTVAGCQNSTDPSQVTLAGPSNLATDGAYVYSIPSSFGGCPGVVRKTSLATGATTSLGSLSTFGVSYITYASDGNLYIQNDGTITQMNPSTGAKSTVTVPWPANVLPAGGILDDSSGLWVEVNNSQTGVWSLDQMVLGSSPSIAQSVTFDTSSTGVALASQGGYLYADRVGAGDGYEVVQISEITGAVSFVAGSGSSGYQDGVSTEAWFGSIAGITSDGSSLWVTDAGAYRLREITDNASPLPEAQLPAYNTTLSLSSGVVSTAAGNAGTTATDGYGSAATMPSAVGLVYDSGRLYLGDPSGIRTYDPGTGAVSTLIRADQNYRCADSIDRNSVTESETFNSFTSDGTYLYSVCGSTEAWLIRRTNLTTGATATVADVGPGNRPSLVYGSDGYLYIIFPGFQLTIVRMDPQTGLSTRSVLPLGNQGNQTPANDNDFFLTADSGGIWFTGITVYDESTLSEQIDEISYGTSPSIVKSFTYQPYHSGISDWADGITSAGSELYVAREENGTDQIFAVSKSSGAMSFVAGSATAGSSAAMKDGVGAGAVIRNTTGFASDGSILWFLDDGYLRRVGNGVAGAPLTDAELLGGGNPSQPCSCAAAQLSQSTQWPVDDQTGNFWHTFTDLAVPGRGIPLDFRRTYNSDPYALATPGLFGPGWSFSYGMSLSVSGSSVTVSQENGSQVSFTQSGSTFTPAQSSTEATLAQNIGGTYTFTRQGTVSYTFNQAGQLVSEADMNGYTTTLTYPSSSQMVITDPAGRSLTATISGGHIVSLADTDGRTVSYQYSDAYGDLTDVIDVNGGHWQFVYNNSHQMVLMRTPRFYTTGAPPAAPTSCSASPPSDFLTNVYDLSGRVICQWDPDGHQTRFDYATVPGSTIVTDPKGNQTLYSFNYGLLTSETKGYGTSQEATWTFAYDSVSGGISEVVDPNGHTSNYYYDSSGNQTTTVDPMGRVTTSTYNQYNEVTSVTPPATYGSAGPVTTTYRYDEAAYSAAGAGNLTTVSTPILSPTGASEGTQTTHYVYGDSARPGDVTSTIDPNGNTWAYTYDSYGDKISQMAPATSDNSDATGAVNHLTRWAYNTATGWVTAELAPRFTQGHPNATTCSPPNPGCTTYTYDNAGRLLVTTDGNGNTTTNHYDADGDLDYTIDGNNNKTSYTHDPAEQLTVTTRADQSTLQTNYWPDGAIEDQINAAGADTHYTYDPLGHLVSVTNPENQTTGYTYDAVGNLLVKADPGVTGCTPTSTTRGCTIYTYDADNEPAGINYNDTATPNVTAVGYDGDGRKVTMTDGTGTTTWGFNSLGLLETQASGAGATVGYAYDPAGNQTEIAYPGSTGTIHKTYDAENRQSSITDWAGNTTTVTYDADADLASSTDPTTVNGAVGTPVTDTYAFNNADQEKSANIAQGATSLASFSYKRDSAGQLSQVTSTGVPSDNHTYGYSPLEQLTTTGTNSGSYAYDPANDPIQLADNTVQTFDPASQLSTSSQISLVGTATAGGTGATTSSKVTLPAGAQTGDEIVAAVTLNVGTGVATPAGYNLVGTYSTGSTTTDAQTLVYDHTVAAGDTAVTFNLSAAEPRAVVLADYRGVNTTTPIDTTTATTGSATTSLSIPTPTPTNPGDQLVVLEGAANAPAAGTFAGPTGTTTEVTKTAGTSIAASVHDKVLDTTNPTGTLNFGYSQTAELTGVALSLNPAQTTYAYDAKGERTTISPPTETATTLTYNQAGELTSYGTTATYTYDGDGLRATKTVNGTTQDFTWDQSGSLPQILSDGTKSYLYGPDGVPLEQTSTTGTTLWYHHDQGGNTRLLTDNTGAVEGTVTYSPTGTPTTTGQTTPLGYGDGYTDPETGLVYLINRYYDPATAQFLNVDPLVGLTGQPYSYAGDDPVNETDPLGLWPGWHDITGAASAVAGGAADAWNATGGKAVHVIDTAATVGGCISGGVQLFGGVHGSVCVVHTGQGWAGGVSGGFNVGPSAGANVTAGVYGSSDSCVTQLNENGGSSGGISADVGEGIVGQADFGAGGKGKQTSVEGYLGGGVGVNWTPPALPVDVGGDVSWSHWWQF